MPRDPLKARIAPEQSAELLDLAPKNLWGVLSIGRFISELHATKATEWLGDITAGYGGFIQTWSNHFEDVMGWPHDEAESYRLRVVRLLAGETENSLPYIVLTAARMLAQHAGHPEPAPQMEGDSKEVVLGRALYVVERYFEGKGRMASRIAGYEDSYVANVKSKKRKPSDKFLLDLAHAAGCSSDWLRFGRGLPWMTSGDL